MNPNVTVSHVFIGVIAFVGLCGALRPAHDVAFPEYSAYSIEPRPLLDQITLRPNEPLDAIIAQQITALRRTPFSVNALTELGARLTERYDFDQAIVFLTLARTIAPRDAQVWIALGKHYYARRDFNEALAMFLKAAKLAPMDPTVLTYAGRLRLLFKKDGIKEARRFFKLVLELEPRNLIAYREFFRTEARATGPRPVVAALRGRIARDPTDELPRLATGDIWLQFGHTAAARAAFDGALRINPASCDAHRGLAQTARAEGARRRAEREWLLAADCDRRDAASIFAAAESKWARKDFRGATNLAELVVERRPNYPGIHAFIAQLDFAVGKTQDGLAELRTEVEKNPEDYPRRLELARKLMDTFRFAEARVELAVIDALPDLTVNPEFIYVRMAALGLMTRCYRAEGRWEEAAAAAEKALRWDPQSADFLQMRRFARQHRRYGKGEENSHSLLPPARYHVFGIASERIGGLSRHLASRH